MSHYGTGYNNYCCEDNYANRHPCMRQVFPVTANPWRHTPSRHTCCRICFSVPSVDLYSLAVKNTVRGIHIHRTDTLKVHIVFDAAVVRTNARKLLRTQSEPLHEALRLSYKNFEDNRRQMVRRWNVHHDEPNGAPMRQWRCSHRRLCRIERKSR